MTIELKNEKSIALLSALLNHCTIGTLGTELEILANKLPKTKICLYANAEPEGKQIEIYAIKDYTLND